MAHGAYLYEILGLTPYQDAMAIQQDLAGARSQGAVPDVVMVLEHEPVISLGSRAVAAEELLLAAVDYTRRGIDVVEVSRGGRSTYHGPGQLVCYPVLDLQDYGKDLHRYVHNLEEVLIATLRALGIDGRRMDARGSLRRLGRRAQDRVDRRPLRPLDHDARLLAERRSRSGRLRDLRRLRPGRRGVHIGDGGAGDAGQRRGCAADDRRSVRRRLRRRVRAAAGGGLTWPSPRRHAYGPTG